MALQETVESARPREGDRSAGEYRSGVVGSLLRALDRHDTYTAAHCLRASVHAVAIAGALGCPPAQIELLRQAALVHDIGKIRIPVDILRKPVDLDAEEDHLVRLHPALGADLVSRFRGLEDFIPIVLHHHERWDGRGYPHGVAGSDIPLASRILFVADAFDAMTTKRPYGRISTATEAVAEINRCGGRQFDPQVAAAASILTSCSLTPSSSPPRRAPNAPSAL